VMSETNRAFVTVFGLQI